MGQLQGSLIRCPLLRGFCLVPRDLLDQLLQVVCGLFTRGEVSPDEAPNQLNGFLQLRRLLSSLKWACCEAMRFCMRQSKDG